MTLAVLTGCPGYSAVEARKANQENRKVNEENCKVNQENCKANKENRIVNKGNLVDGVEMSFAGIFTIQHTT